MDTMRSSFGSLAESGGYDHSDEDTARQAPPPAIGQDERRMQVRAYNHWASLLEERNFPAIEDLEPENLPDFGPYSVLLDFSSGIENPGIAYLGEKLAQECDVGDGELNTLADVPSLSLLSRITDHYLQIIANQAPIGFEAEFVNQRGATIAYRGILLPYSSDDDTIDFIYGVINWKELADAKASDELLLEIDQALDAKPARTALASDEPMTDWADGPGAVAANDLSEEPEESAVGYDEPVAGGPLADEPVADYGVDDGGDLPVPSFGLLEDEPGEYELEDELEDELEGDEPVDAAEEEADTPSPYGSLLKTPIHLSHSGGKTPVELPDYVPEGLDEDEFGSEYAPEYGAEFGPEVEPESALPEIALPDLDPAEMELGDWLAAAREMAAQARTSEDRTRNALYEAIGRAYDFSLAAADAPAEFDELLNDSGLTMQDRAPMTPVVKLVFGADYDKTRLTEYASALTHAHRIGLERGTLGQFLVEAEGGLKGVVKAERRLRREEAGKDVEPVDAPRHALARKLRALAPQDFASIAPEGSEFALVMIRRTDEGEVVMLGEVPDDLALVERAARRLVG